MARPGHFAIPFLAWPERVTAETVMPERDVPAHTPTMLPVARRALPLAAATVALVILGAGAGGAVQLLPTTTTAGEAPAETTTTSPGSTTSTTGPTPSTRATPRPQTRGSSSSPWPGRSREPVDDGPRAPDPGAGLGRVQAGDGAARPGHRDRRADRLVAEPQHGGRLAGDRHGHRLRVGRGRSWRHDRPGRTSATGRASERPPGSSTPSSRCCSPRSRPGSPPHPRRSRSTSRSSRSAPAP